MKTKIFLSFHVLSYFNIIADTNILQKVETSHLLMYSFKYVIQVN